MEVIFCICIFIIKIPLDLYIFMSKLIFLLRLAINIYTDFSEKVGY